MTIIFNLYALLDVAIIILLGGGSTALLGPVGGLAFGLPLIIAAQLFLEYRGMGGRLFWLPTIIPTSFVGSAFVAKGIGLPSSIAFVGMIIAVVASQRLKKRGEQSRRPGPDTSA